MNALNGNRTSVYIVEDSCQVRERLSLLLSDIPNVEVIGQEGRASEAIAEIRQKQPDIVTLDLRLAQGTGVDVLRAVKQDPNPPRVVVLTNFSEQPYRSFCRNLGADYFFDKTIDFPEMIDLIHEWSCLPQQTI